jgi:alkylation response protein AidB-like acyl-CoA dehydrogenase/flavin-dependent dehydrogenase/electron transfer flavoprotein alpha/beta subunit/ferredoxin-like protein FixX
MTSPQFDVVIVGGGCAGMTAAIGLAKSGFSVAVVEAAAFPGAENWSGCVYFCENLIHPDILGPEGVAALAWERRLVERGFFATDGHGLLGLTYRDPAAFQHCYTVLRPIFDHHLALHAQQVGVVILNETTAESLIRDGTRVIGVCTQRGPLYADLVFLAEGDASHLVTREGYERHTDPREQPKFLHGIKQVIDLPPGAVEETFGVGAGEGVAYEMLLRNGTLRGKQVHLNMGGFVYTNRQSLSIGLVLPADHLHEHFEGDPNLLIEWFSQLPALQPWLKQGKRGVFGAKLIRGGGARDIPRLIDDGLAIGGAASGIGIDFPYPNFTGPATYMGLLLVQAARRIREEKSRFSLEKLQQHYLEPLQRCHYYQDVEFLRRWPAYVERTTVFFDRNIDLTLGTAYIWTRPGRWLPRRILNWVRLLWVQAGPAQWTELRDDGRQLMKALQVAEVVGRPSVWRLLLDGTVNALRDLFGSPRPYLPSSGQVRLHYATAGGQEPSGNPPGFIRRWGQRFLPVVAAAAAKVYANDREPLAGKLRSAVRLLMRQVNIMDVTAAGLLGLLIALAAAIMAAWSRLRSKLRQRPAGTVLGSDSRRYEKEARQATDMTAVAASAAQQWEGRLGHLAYETVKDSHISVLWPQALPDKNRAAKQGLWHVCPAHVYEARQNAQGQLQVIVNFENCIKCETCWRTSDMVDWGRDGNHRFIYPVHSPSIERLLPALAATATAQPRLPRTIDPWGAAAPLLREPRSAGQNGAAASEHAEILPLLDRLERKLEEFDESLAAEPRTIDKARAAYLEMLARYAQQLAVQLDERARSSDSPPLRALAVALTQKAEERSRRCAAGRYRWAAADGRQMRHHHLAGLRRLLPGQAMLPADPNQRWLAAERHGQASAALRAEWSARLDAVLPASTWRELDRRQPLSQEQDALLRELLARVPAIDPERLDSTLHPTARKVLLAELGRRDPSLAYRAAGHLWARDLAKLAAGASAALAKASKRWTKGEEWACFAAVAATSTREGWQGEVLFVPARDAQIFLLLVGDQLAVIDVPREPHSAGLLVEPLATLGLRGAGLARLRLDQFALPETRATVDAARILRAWNILSAADLTAIAFGMADVLCERAIAHAANRVQFPGLFHDEQSRDAIGKFGAVKKLLAEMAARRFLLETLDHVLSPADLSGSSLERAELVKATAADALGKLAYNAGQVFGGTGFSEDDILAKYYRDASAWRFLGPPNIEVWRRHGTALLHDWQADGQQLASLRGEAEVFDQVVQRKALQGELDAVRVVRGQLRGLVNDYLKPGVAEEQRPKLSPVALAEVGEGLARQDAQLLASKALLLRLHARLEHGLTSETELSLLRVWLNGVTAESLDFESCLRLHTTLTAPPVASPEGKALPRTYRDYLAAAAPYDSGDFLSKPLDLQRPRYVPEMIATDPNLSEADRRLRERISGWFGRPQDDGLPYERHIERRHRPSPEDLDYCRRAGFFRFPIPKELGGEGKSKAEYYLLTTGCQRLADVAISLTIQVSSSLGTTPVLLTRTKELPRAEKELAAFSADTSLQSQITSGLQNIRQLLDSGNPAAVKQAYLDLQKLLTATVLTSTAGKALLHRFLDAWQQAGRAGLAFDLAAMGRLLEQAARHWQDGCARAEDYRLEFGRRREAADLFLRWVASGQISGFALTEPSAGSDTARVATRAVLRAVPVERAADGVLKFIPQGGKEPRYLLDARQVEFRASPDNPELQPVYRWSAQAEPAPLRFDEYDYETDDPRRSRYYQHGERKVYFSDIAQLRERDGQLWYDYWELTGAKMWITNGRMMGVMCLYAKTDEGITGFIVDRHAEGLIVGKDEEKLGQCGSPTNELSLQAVRVPRENVIGIEGRGQVNALETLNVGRAGLAMSAMAQMAGLIEQSRVFAQAHYDGIPDWVGWRLQRMEAERFTSEALAHEVVGRFEHPQTKSVRLESAIAKMLVSEALHRVIALAEEIHGLAGQTQEHLVEKRKRDARVLNIYEGTNEIQRFFILKDLPVPDQSTAKDLQREAADLERLRQQVGQRLQSAAGYFGAEIWQNPNLQANCFLLSEAVAWFKAAESTLGRKQWIGSAEDAARRALLQCSYEVQNRLRHFDEEMVRLRRGFYAEEVRAASLLFRHEAAAQPITPPANRIIRPLAVLVVVEPSVAALPQPHVEDGRLVAAYWSLSPADRAAVETALQLRDAAPDHVEIQVAAVAPETAAGALRELLSVGVRRARLLVLPAGEVTPDSGAAALATALRPSGPFELVLGGSGTGQEEGLLARLTAEALGVHHAGSTAQLSVHWTDKEAEVRLLGSERRQRVRSLPMGLAIEPELKLRSFAVAGSLQGLSRNVEVERWPRKATARGVTLFEAMPAGVATADDAGTELNPRQAADRLLQELGHRAGAAGSQVAYRGDIEDVSGPGVLAGRVVALLGAGADGQLEPTASLTVRAASLVAETWNRELAALLLVSSDETSQGRAVGQLRAFYPGEVLLFVAEPASDLAEVRGRLLRDFWPKAAPRPGAVVGEPWTEMAFAALSTRIAGAGTFAARIRRLGRDGDVIVAETLRVRGKLRAVQRLEPATDRTCWLTLAADAEVAAPLGDAMPTGKVERWQPVLEQRTGHEEILRMLDEARAEVNVGRLADAEFIIDVGFGVGNRDAYDAVIEPLEQALRQLGVAGLMIGGSRKVTEELHLLPADRQIGQSGVSVNPRILLAIGVSGAPQHLNYIGSRTAILAFNRDPEAPIMTLNRRQPRPKVFPVAGDLFETVPLLIAALKQEAGQPTNGTAAPQVISR